MDGTDTILSGDSAGARKDWRESLEVVVARTGHGRYRWLCSDDNPDPMTRDGYRALMVSQATGGPAPAPEPGPTPEDLALRAYAARHGCGGCGH